MRHEASENPTISQTMYKVVEKTFKKHDDLAKALEFIIDMNQTNMNATFRLGSIKAFIDRLPGTHYYICSSHSNNFKS